jgi:hypothetical protein
MLARNNIRQYDRYKYARINRTGCSQNVSGDIEQCVWNGSLKSEIAGSNPARAANH